ncbi:MAG: hypothetical protein Ct9H90mP7_0110 [Candidatus Neomarinimicrobiota bacterium]|nr:MAG: hypothetical protein Ct9H90mP7_0110 [Candidatus Neomarinimicrobiota bacterium]
MILRDRTLNNKNLNLGNEINSFGKSGLEMNLFTIPDMLYEIFSYNLWK